MAITNFFEIDENKILSIDYEIFINKIEPGNMSAINVWHKNQNNNISPDTK